MKESIWRTSNHNLPIETGRWKKIPITERKCTLCQSVDLGDEFHYLFICPLLHKERTQLLSKYFYIKPNMYKMNLLFNSKKQGTLRKLCNFCKIIMQLFKT